MRLYTLLLTATLAAGLSAPAQAVRDPAFKFQSDSLNLRFNYPDSLQKRDLSEAVADGHLTLSGLSPAPQQAPGTVAGCLRPLLFVQSSEPGQTETTSRQTAPDGTVTVRITPATAATILLAELDPTCLASAEAASNHKELPEMARQLLLTPGMNTLAQPTPYTIGRQRVVMAAAQGHPPQAPGPGADAVQPATPSAFTLFTMAVATTWNNHLLVWFLTSNQIATLDQLSKSTVRFGREAAAPLYPLTLGNASPAGSPQ